MIVDKKVAETASLQNYHWGLFKTVYRESSDSSGKAGISPAYIIRFRTPQPRWYDMGMLSGIFRIGSRVCGTK